VNARRTMLKAIAGGALLHPVLAHAASSRAAPLPASGDGPRAGYFPNAFLETHDGRKVRFYDDLIKGRVVIINMMYTVCTVTCPPTTANLLSVQQSLEARLGRDVFMYSLTLRPEFDTPQALNEYARSFNVGRGWTFLTGKPGDMESIRRKLGFFDPDPQADTQPMRHTGMLRIGNERRDRWLMAPALGSTAQIVGKISSLL
jgi:protein SCO1/2